MHQILQPFVLVLLGIVRLIVPGAQPQESGGDARGIRGTSHLIPRQLVHHKGAVIQIAIERVDHPVAVFPREWLFLVTLVARCLRPPSHIQPVPCPPLPVPRAGQQFLHHPLVGVRARVRLECLHFLVGGWQPGQVEAHPAQERGLVRRRGHFPAFFRQPLANEMVHRVRAGGLLVFLQRLQAPQISPTPRLGGKFIGVQHPACRPRGPRLHPRRQNLLFLRGQWPRLPLGWWRHGARHHPLHQQAVLTVHPLQRVPTAPTRA